MDHFISSLPSPPAFRRFLLDLKNAQDSALFQLEQEYLTLVRDRRTALINYLRSTSNANGKRSVGEGLKEMHAGTQAEFDAFLKVKVYYGWQLGQVEKQIEALISAGFPRALLSSTGINNTNANFNTLAYYQCIMDYLLLKLH